MSFRAGLQRHKRIVVKVGTTTLTYANGKLNFKLMDKLCMVLTDLRNQGKDVILVSSGAIAVGADRLGLAERPRDIPGKQAASAVGQAVLIQIYENFFINYNQKTAQILLTRDVMEQEHLRDNARNTFFTLLSLGVIPIVNENDTISVEELGFSENDNLSARVACLADAELLILLSDQDGMYDEDPGKNPQARLIPVVDGITADVEAMAGDSASALGTGGFAAKVGAAKMANAQGIDVVVASGADPEVLFDILAGAEKGTLFRGRRE